MSQDTTPAELLSMAHRHKETSPAVSALLVSITEDWSIANAASLALDEGHTAARRVLNNGGKKRFPHDNSTLVLSSHNLASALSRLNSAFGTLATVLSSLGENVVY